MLFGSSSSFRTWLSFHWCFLLLVATSAWRLLGKTRQLISIIFLVRFSITMLTDEGSTLLGNSIPFSRTVPLVTDFDRSNESLAPPNHILSQVFSKRPKQSTQWTNQNSLAVKYELNLNKWCSIRDCLWSWSEGASEFSTFWLAKQGYIVERFEETQKMNHQLVVSIRNP